MRRLVAIGTLLMLAGCAGSDPADAPDSAETVSEAAISTTSDVPDDPAASVEQYAGIVATVHDDWLDAVDEFNTECDWTFEQTQPCKLQMLGLTVKAETVGLVVNSAGDPSDSRYLGAPPDEVAGLYTDTLAAVDGIAVAEQAWSGGGCLPPGVTCEEGASLAWAVDDLSDAMHRWDPYI